MATTIRHTFDYIVIGGGTAGAIVAARLAENPNHTVCLVEAGAADEGRPQVLHLKDWPAMLGSEFDYDYTIEPQPRGNSTIRHSRGKVLGGCSSHNSCIAFRTPDSDLNTWEKLGAKGWAPNGVKKHFEKLLQKVNIEDIASGQIPVQDDLLESCRQVGLPTLKFNIKNESMVLGEGAGYFQLNKKGEVRHSSSVAYLHPLNKLPSNFTLMTNTKCVKVLLDDSNRRATGVLTSDGRELLAREEIVISCGAFDTPKLLLLSGIGPQWHLREIGIPTRVNVPGVGENLLDHPESIIMWEVNTPINNDKSTQYWEVGLFARTPECDPNLSPDLMLHFGSVTFDINTYPAGYPTARDGISLTPNVCRPLSRGNVRLKNSDARTPPAIDFRYYTDALGYDESVLLHGIKLARRIAATGPLSKWIKRELSPGQEVQSDRELSQYLRKVANTVYHPAGTCKMGDVSKDPLAVVDEQLRVRGISNLRVADASVFPTMITVNPCMTIMMIGEKCADLIKSSYQPKPKL